MTQEKNVLLYGIGNDILSDDGIGPRFVWKLEKEFNYPFVKYETAFLGGMEILEYIRGYKKVIFIDAIKTEGGVPGAIYELTPANFTETLHLSHVHDVSFLTALELGKRSGYEVTDDIRIVAIEIVEDLEFSESYSPELEKNIDAIFEEVKRIVMSYLEEK